MSTRATITINTDAERAQIARWAQNVDVGTVVTFRKKSRSTEQNAKLHAMLGEVAAQVEWYGAKLDPEDWKDMFTASLRHARVVPGIDKGTFVPLGMHTSTLTIEEMSNLIELIYAFGADPEHPVIFKDPKEQSNPDDGQSPVPTSSDSSGTAPELGSGDLAAHASPLPQHADWLFNVAKMLWAATNPKGDIDVLKAQKRAAIASFPMDDDCPPVILGKATSVYGYCERVVEGAIKPDDGLALIAGVVGVDQDDLKQRSAA